MEIEIAKWKINNQPKITLGIACITVAHSIVLMCYCCCRRSCWLLLLRLRLDAQCPLTNIHLHAMHKYAGISQSQWRHRRPNYARWRRSKHLESHLNIKRIKMILLIMLRPAFGGHFFAFVFLFFSLPNPSCRLYIFFYYSFFIYNKPLALALSRSFFLTPLRSRTHTPTLVLTFTFAFTLNWFDCVVIMTATS